MACCHVPGMDCPSAQAAEALIWASCSPNPASTPAPLSSGRIGPAPSSLPPSALGTSPRPQSGTTYAASTHGPSAAPSTSSSPDIPVNRSAQLESEVAQTIPVTSGPRSPASSGNAPPSGCYSKMSRVTSASALRPSCESFGAWATRLRRVCSARQKSVHRTSGSAFSSWPTPMSLHPGKRATPGGPWRPFRAVSCATGWTHNGCELTKAYRYLQKFNLANVTSATTSKSRPSKTRSC